MADISSTIKAKSDQVNADDLLGGAMTIVITKVDINNKDIQQPITIHYEGENGRPYKPSLGMRRVLVHLWTKESKNYIGKSLTLFREPNVTWAGKAVGGVRISHMSDIDKAEEIELTVSRGNKKPFTVLPLKTIDTAPLLKAGLASANKGMEAYMKWGKSLAPEERSAVESELPNLTAIAKAVEVVPESSTTVPEAVDDIDNVLEEI